MSAYGQAPEGPAGPKRGCLWGCVGTLIAASLLVAAVLGYGGWYFYKSFSNDSRTQLVLDAARADNRVIEVLGKNVHLEGIETFTYDESTGRGGTATYVLNVAGSRGTGKLHAELDFKGEKTKITQLVLNDSDGRSYYLIGVPPPNPMLQNSI